MSASMIKVTCLDCDQGMGNLIRIYDESGKLGGLALVDLGAEIGKRRYAYEGLNEVLAALYQMRGDGYTPAINLLIVSHQDYDHWSLLGELREIMGKDIPTSMVGHIFYGGINWRGNALAELNAWKKQFNCHLSAMPEAHSDYFNPVKLTELGFIEDVVFRVLAVNVPCLGTAADLVRNGTSAVIVVEFGGVRVVFPGDATAETLGHINDLFAFWENKGYEIPVTPCHVLSVPHHGALRTIASNFTTINPNLDIAAKFAEYLKAQNVVASAGYQSGFFHPYESVLNLFSKYVLGARNHTYVVYDNAEPAWRQYSKEEGIYTTIRNLDRPPIRDNVPFEIKSSGEIRFGFEDEKPVKAPSPRPIALPSHLLKADPKPDASTPTDLPQPS